MINQVHCSTFHWSPAGGILEWQKQSLREGLGRSKAKSREVSYVISSVMFKRLTGRHKLTPGCILVMGKTEL